MHAYTKGRGTKRGREGEVHFEAIIIIQKSSGADPVQILNITHKKFGVNSIYKLDAGRSAISMERPFSTA